MQAYLLNSVFVTLFQRKNFIGALLCIVNLFPCLIFFLLKQGDTIGEELCVSFDAIGKITAMRIVGNHTTLN